MMDEIERKAQLNNLRNDVIFWKGVSVFLLLGCLALGAYIFFHR